MVDKEICHYLETMHVSSLPPIEAMLEVNPTSAEES